MKKPLGGEWTRRHALVALQAAALAAALGAGALQAGPAFAQEKKTITFAASLLADPSRGPLYRKWIEIFNASHPDIEVKPVGIPFSSFSKTILTQLGGGQGPDVMRLDLNDFYPAAGSGLLMDLSDKIDPKQYDFIGPDKYMSVKGKRYAVVLSMTPYALIYNKDLWTGQPPSTFEELLAAAKAARTDKVYGFAFRTTMNQASGFWQDVCNFVYGFGGQWVDKAGKLAVNSPQVVAGVKAYKDIYAAGVTPEGATSSEYRQMFWEGKVAFMVDNGGVAGLLANQAPNLQLAAAPSPFPHREQGMVLAVLAVNQNSKNKEAGLEFVKWVLTPEAQKAFLQIPGEIYAGTKVLPPLGDSEAARKFEPVLKVYADQADYGTPQLVPGYEEETPQMQQIILEQVVRVLKAGVEPQAAMDRAQQEIERRVLRR